MLSFLLNSHLLNNPRILVPIISSEGLTPSIDSLIYVYLLALLCNLGLAVDQTEEVISIEARLLGISFCTDRLSQVLPTQLTDDKLAAHLNLWAQFCIRLLLLNCLNFI